MPAERTEILAELAAALASDPAARASFDALPPSHRNEYTQWIAGAKKAETRVKRAEKTIAMLRERKPSG